MKKSLIFITSLIFVLPFAASAASFVVTPNSGTYSVGDTITLNISVDPTPGAVFTAMLDATLTPSIFEVKSFTLNDTMLPLKMPGYDAINNTAGALIKTGGYPGGARSATPFGTLVLRAKGSGVGTFTINSGSKLLAADNHNQQVGTQTVSFTINSIPVVQPVGQTTTQGETLTNGGVNNTINGAEASGTSTGTKVSATSTVALQLASVASFAMSNIIPLIALVFLISILLVSIITRRRSV